MRVCKFMNWNATIWITNFIFTFSNLDRWWIYIHSRNDLMTIPSYLLYYFKNGKWSQYLPHFASGGHLQYRIVAPSPVKFQEMCTRIERLYTCMCKGAYNLRLRKFEWVIDPNDQCTKADFTVTFNNNYSTHAN